MITTIRLIYTIIFAHASVAEELLNHKLQMPLATRKYCLIVDRVAYNAGISLSEHLVCNKAVLMADFNKIYRR
jgi:hypothetical protein